MTDKITTFWWNLRFSLGMKIGGFTQAQRWSGLESRCGWDSSFPCTCSDGTGDTHDCPRDDIND